MGLYDKPDFGANKPAYDPLEAEKLRKLKPQLAAQENESIQQAPASAPIYPVTDPRNTQVTAARIGAGLAQKQPSVASSMNMPSATGDSVPANNQAQVMAEAQPGIGYQLKSMPENEQTSSFAKFKQDGVTNYVGKGNPLTPEQQAKNDARLAQGNEMRARLGLGAMGANGRLVSSNAGVPEEFVSDGSFDPTQPGAIAGMAYLAKAAQIRAGIQNQNAQNTIAAQNAQTQAGLGASENAVRGIGILSAQRELAEKQKIDDLRNKLASTTDQSQRNALMKEIADMSPNQDRYQPLMGKDEMGNPVFMGAFNAHTGQRLNNDAGTSSQPASQLPPIAQRVNGQTYQTPTGPHVWVGNGWQKA